MYSSYHGGHTTDIRYLIKKYESEFNKIYLIGFSLGGNAMLKYLGEEATNISTKLKKAIAISVPCDFFGSALKIIYKPNNFIYQYRFLKKLKTKLLDKAPLYPKQLSVNEIKKVKTLEEFDDYYTAPAHGFKNGRDYWHYASTLDNLPHIKVPTLLINALDDPFLSENCFPYKIAKEHSFLDLETPKYGGHVGFYQSKPLLWHEERALEFLGKS
ncbi:MAG: alpha/beta hydrolase [Cytophagales bacterium]|nr:alpha/beta hydrolase [Cytophagales bacterium]